MVLTLNGSESSLSVNRVFSLEDQHWFAGLSGDYNPIHLDELTAYQSQYPQPLVHGIHVVLWCLQHISQSTSKLVLSKLSVRFRLPVLVNQNVKLYITQHKSNTWKAAVYSGHKKLVTLTAISSDFSKTSIQQLESMPFNLPTELEVDQKLEGLSGSISLHVNRTSLQQAFG